ARVPWLIGGTADLAPSTKTHQSFEGAGEFEADTPGGRNLHFGVREHAMGAILNGLALTRLRAYGSTTGTAGTPGAARPSRARHRRRARGAQDRHRGSFDVAASPHAGDDAAWLDWPWTHGRQYRASV